MINEINEINAYTHIFIVKSNHFAVSTLTNNDNTSIHIGIQP